MDFQQVCLQIIFLRKLMIAIFATELGLDVALVHHMSVQMLLYRVRTIAIGTFERSSVFYTNQNTAEMYYSIFTVTCGFDDS